ncbi:MAG: sugar phosphate isomerase/epimerase family protein [Limisphaerales bacterium]
MTTTMTRRKMLGTLASAAPLVAAAPLLFSAEAANRKRLGVCAYSYNLHWKAARDGRPGARFKDSIEFLEYCRQLGAGGVQTDLSSRDAEGAAKLRAKAEACQMYLEGQVSLPQQESDVARFDADIRAAKEAGAEVVRTAMLSGRRYETFDSAEAFRKFETKSWDSLTLAEPIARKHRVKLAIENHKDHRASELLGILKRAGSEYVGACVDLGNNLALLEEPMQVVETLGPVAFSTHVKDMAVQEDADGFLLSEVPLGDGFLELKRMLALLQQANPKIQFNLEMITRDPLKIPCLTQKYWATMEALPAPQLAAALTMVRRNAAKKSLPRTSGLDLEQQLTLEDENVRASFAYARQRLGL